MSSGQSDYWNERCGYANEDELNKQGDKMSSSRGYKWDADEDVSNKHRQDNIFQHKVPVVKGILGDLSKIQEELDELKDAVAQHNNIIIYTELADLYGAIEMFVNEHCPRITMMDIIDAAKIKGNCMKK